MPLVAVYKTNDEIPFLVKVVQVGMDFTLPLRSTYRRTLVRRPFSDRDKAIKYANRLNDKFQTGLGVNDHTNHTWVF